MSKTTLNEMNYLVNNHETFEGNSVFSKWENDKYVVYSYGYHFPMYVWDSVDQVWVGNQSKYSVTTSKHQSKCRPSGVSKWLNTDEMKKMLRFGSYSEYVVLRGDDV